jgi:hypothetical protein
MRAKVSGAAARRLGTAATALGTTEPEARRTRVLGTVDHARLAQLVERTLGKGEVVRSSRTLGSNTAV